MEASSIGTKVNDVEVGILPGVLVREGVAVAVGVLGLAAVGVAETPPGVGVRVGVRVKVGVNAGG